MVFFSAIISIVLVENVLSAINRENQYIELDNTTTEAYFCIEEDNCNVVYICKKRNEKNFLPMSYLIAIIEMSILVWDLFQTIEINLMTVTLKDMLILKVINVILQATEVVIASYNQPIEFNRVRYYDWVVYQDPNSKTNVEIDLTEYGCCTITRDDKDTKWIENLPHHIQINQINITGTHNSGTYAIGETGFNFLSLFETTMIALKRQIFMTNWWMVSDISI